jgi:hypothetical protein
MQKIQPLYCWEGVLTAPVHSNGSYSNVACVFVAAGMCLPSRCLVINVYSDFTIPAFGRHVTICHMLYSPVTDIVVKRTIKKTAWSYISTPHASQWSHA